MASVLTTEKQMRPIVVAWLAANGYEVAHECGRFDNCDVVGYRFAERTGRPIPPLETVVCVELKIRDFEGVLRQCRAHRDKCHQVYAAMPSHILRRAKVETYYKIRDSGVGLLAVDPESGVTVGMKSLNYNGDFQFARKALWAWHRGLRGRKDCP